jgi:galactokinase
MLRYFCSDGECIMSLNSKKLFREKFGYEPSEMYFSPGRVNLIGEYTDIAGGHVLPMAIQLGIEASVSLRKDRTVRVFSFKDTVSFSLDNLEKNTKHSWINYIIGEFYELEKRGVKVEKGFDIALDSSLPVGSGLSSSACLEVLIGTIINQHSLKKVEKLEIVKASKENENEFMGLSSGIMDQFACEMGEEGKCIFLDTKTIEYKLSPFIIQGHDLVIMNSNRPRKLTDSKYNDRVREMKEGLEDLKPYLNFNCACDISLEDLEKYKDKINNPLSYKRLKHLISDNLRVIKASELLSQGRVDEFCKVLNEGHQSVSKDFEVAGFELDTLCEEALKGGAKGARMTGAGFGGCCIFVSEKSKTKEIMLHVVDAYRQKTGYNCQCYIASPNDGAKKIS